MKTSFFQFVLIIMVACSFTGCNVTLTLTTGGNATVAPQNDIKPTLPITLPITTNVSQTPAPAPTEVRKAPQQVTSPRPVNAAPLRSMLVRIKRIACFWR